MEVAHLVYAHGKVDSVNHTQAACGLRTIEMLYRVLPNLAIEFGSLAIALGTCDAPASQSHLLQPQVGALAQPQRMEDCAPI
jgi:hypothetical protein